MDRDNWKTKITNSSMLRTYFTFKENPHFELYVYKIKNRQDRSLLSKLRFGILPLQVEIRRWPLGGGMFSLEQIGFVKSATQPWKIKII